MRRLPTALTLALYAFSVSDLHEWAHVPQTIAHWLEHHTDLGHYDEGRATATMSMGTMILSDVMSTEPAPHSRS